MTDISKLVAALLEDQLFLITSQSPRWFFFFFFLCTCYVIVYHLFDLVACVCFDLMLQTGEIKKLQITKAKDQNILYLDKVGRKSAFQPF